jgi:uncharacterized protein YfaS (alpha-2-macroglobulin family)
MDRRRLVLGLVLALALCWVAYSAYVFNLESLQSNQQTVLMTSDTVAGGGNVTAHVVVTNRKNGNPLAGANVTVTLSNGSGEQRVVRGTAGEDGHYVAQFRAPERNGTYNLSASARTDLGTDTVESRVQVTRERRIYVDTDKPIYRPGQTIHARTIVSERGGDPITGNATLSVTGPNGNRLYSRPVDLNEFGMGQADVPIAAVGRTGDYRVTVESDGERRSKTVSVREYQTPQFEVQFRPDQTSYRPGDTVRATVTSEYFFGEPVANATVEIEGRGYVGDLETFGTATATADEEGVATLDLELPGYFVGTERNENRGLAVLNVSVTDSAGHTETITRRLTVTEDDLLVDAYPASGNLVPGVENTVYLTLRYPDGRPAQGTIEVDDETVETNANGVATYTFVPEGDRGQRLELRARAGGRSVTDRVYFDIDDSQGLGLQVSDASPRVGDTVTGQVVVGGEAESVYLDVLANRQTVLTKRVPVANDRANFSIPVTGSMQGEVTLRAWTVFRDSSVGRTARPLLVQPARDVNVTVTPNQSVYRPGAPATLTVETRENGSAVPAAVGLDVVDESVFAVERPHEGLAAVQYGIDRQLSEPRLFVANRDRGERETDDENASSTAADGQQDSDGIAEAAAIAELGAASDGAVRNSFEVKRQRVETQQQRHQRRNGQLLGLLLALLPLGAVAVGANRYGPGRFLRSLGKAAGLTALVAAGCGVLLVAVGWFLFSGVTWFGDLAPVFRAVVVLATGLLLGLVALFVWHPDDLSLSDPVGTVVGGLDSSQRFLLLGYGVMVGLIAGTVGVAPAAGAILIVSALVVALLGLVVRALDDGISLSRPGWLGLFAGTYVLLVALAVALHQFVAFDAVVPFLPVVVPLALLLPISYLASSFEREDTSAAAVLSVSLALVVLLASVVVASTFVVGLGSQVSQETGQQSGVATGGADGGGGAGGGSARDTAATTDVRQYFPETLTSEVVLTGPDGQATVRPRMADSITSWRISSVASTRSGAIGTNRSSMRVFQPFFLKPDVPTHLTQNDTVSLDVSVFNYENTTKSVTVSLEPADWYTVENETKTVELGPNSVDGVSFRVTAERNGEFPLLITAVGETANGSRSVDAVRRSVTVRPHGERVTRTGSGTIDGTERVEMRVPAERVPNSSQTVVRVYPGAFGQVVQGIDTLLQMPTGCFEQTSSALYPDVLALQYMERTGRGSPELRSTAERFVTTGYQRLLTFETSTPGGYSLFGQNPPNLLLTAYGLQELSDMDEVYAVDPQVIREMETFIVGRQNADGSWPTDGELEYTLGVAGDEVSTTAYVTWSLAESGGRPNAVDDGTAYLRENLDVDSASAGTLAVALNALVAADRYPGLQDQIVSELESRAVTEDSRVHWERSGDDDQDLRYGDKSVLTTALVAHAFAEGDHRPGLTSGALTWIVEQKESDGGWGSTQNTVMALKALVAAQEATGQAPTGTISVSRDGQQVASVELTEQNRDEVQTIVLPESDATGTRSLEISGPGEGSLYYDVTTEYYRPWNGDGRERADGPLSLNVTYDRRNLTVDDTVEARVTVRNDGPAIGMAMVDLQVPPGFALDADQLAELEREGTISRYETRGDRLLLYLEDVSGTTAFPVVMRATQPIEASSGAARSYDYYNPATEAVEDPVQLRVREEE